MAGWAKHGLKVKEFHLPEHYHSKQQAQSALTLLVQRILKARNTLVITGAGLSTASGIPDYRSPSNTRLSTGPGQYHREHPLTFQPVTYAVPSFAHLLITQLARKNLVSTVITQNVDNLHCKALLPSRNLLQVHGNICKQYCQACGLLHYRNFYCRDRGRPRNSDHFNGRYCRSCQGRLLDSLVFFGESYTPQTKARLESIQADLVLVVGSSMTIPAMQRLVKRLKAHTCVMNIQRTALPAELISSHIHHDIQESFGYIAEELGLKVNDFCIQYHMAIEVSADGELRVQLFDFEMTPVDAIRCLYLRRTNGQLESVNYTTNIGSIDTVLEMRILLHGYHGETDIALPQETLRQITGQQTIMHISWSQQSSSWRIEPAH